ncbi:MAG TPA: hypothetical protein VFH19_01210 [Nitrososphaeraceae archaeon]|nr:hypothetical protein [Nitrososphaeraceae archaeon]
MIDVAICGVVEVRGLSPRLVLNVEVHIGTPLTGSQASQLNISLNITGEAI